MLWDIRFHFRKNSYVENCKTLRNLLQNRQDGELDGFDESSPYIRGKGGFDASNPSLP
jgi:hypothetical protein